MDVVQTLSLVLLLESECEAVLSNMNLVTKLVRLMCIFFMGTPTHATRLLSE